MDSSVQPQPTTPTGFEDLIPKKKGSGTPPPVSSSGGPTGFGDLVPEHAKPGFLSQIGQGLEQAGSAVIHPWETGKALIHGIKQSAEDAYLHPAIGSHNTFGGSPGAASVTGFDAQGNPTYNSQVITKANTPDAITPGEKARGQINTLANVVLPGVGGAVSSHLINAGLGAINDPEQPIRGATAGLIIGGVLHHAPSALHGIADVSKDMVPHDLGTDAAYQEQVNPITPLAPKYEGQKIDVNPKTNALSVADESSEVPSPARRPAYILPKNQQPPVEPSASAEGQTFGKTPLTDLTPEQIALRARLAMEHGIPEAAIDDITRRAMNVKPPVEPPETATTQSFIKGLTPDQIDFRKSLAKEYGLRPSAIDEIRRRAMNADVAPEAAPSPTAGFDDLIPEKAAAETATSPGSRITPDQLPSNGSQKEDQSAPVSYDKYGKVVDSRITPIVSSNGTFEARPGVIKATNKALDGGNTIAVLKPGESVSNDEAAARAALARKYNTTPDGTALDMDNPKPIEQPSPDVMKADVQTATAPQIRTRVPKVDMFDDSRTDNGRLRPIQRISDEGLVRELRDLEAKTADAHARSQYAYFNDESGHVTNKIGASVGMATGDKISDQAKAFQNLKDYTRIRQAIYDELGRRGMDESSVNDKVMNQIKLEEAIEREGMQHADDHAAADDAFGDDEDFNFGSNEGAGTGNGRATPEPLASTPKNVSADQLINRSKLDLDPDGEKAFQAETERAKANGLDKGKVSFDTQRAAANDFAKSINMDPTTLDPKKMGRLSGAEIVGLKNVLSKNLNDMGEASKKLADPDLSAADAAKLNDHLDGLRTQNDALMSKIVSETSEKGRDLGFLRQMANASLDPDVWAIQARKVAGRMLSDEEVATVQGLAKAAADACAGGA